MEQSMVINSNEKSVADIRIAGFVREWISFCDVKPDTLTNYNKAVKKLIIYLQEQGIAQPERQDIINFREYLLKTCKPSTAALYLTAVKLFFKFLANKGYYPDVTDHVKGVKFDPSHKKDALTTEDSRRVLQSIDTSTVEGKRNIAIIALMITCGLRSVEVVRANIEDIEQSYNKTFLKVWGKGKDNKSDRVLVPPQVESLINDYLNARGVIDNSEPLFTAISHRNAGQRLQTQTISRLVKSTFKNVGLNTPRLTCHSLRHTAATNMLIHGVDIADVQMILRHRNINTTQIYRHDISRMKNTGECVAANAIFGI